MWGDLAARNVGALLTLPDRSDARVTSDGGRHFMVELSRPSGQL